MIRSRSNSTPADEPLDPAIQAELDQLDAALRGDPIEDDQLAALVRDVQATAPELPSELRKQLRTGVETGFGRRGVRGTVSAALGRGGGRGERPVKRRRTSLVYGGGLAATLLVLVGVGAAVLPTFEAQRGGDFSATEVGPLSGFSSDSTSQASGGGAGQSTQASPKPERLTSEQQRLTDLIKGSSQTLKPSSRGAAVPSTPPSGSSSSSAKRRVQQSVDMTVRVKSGELDEAAGKVENIVRQGRGYVADSQVSIRSRGAGSATFTLRVASSQLDRTMQRLAELGTVTSQDQASRDITSSFDSVQQRLTDNKQVRTALLKALGKAEKDSEISSLNRRLADNRKGRESLERQLAQLRNRTDQSTIALSLRAPSSGAADPDDDGRWSLGDAFSDAGHALSTVTGVLLVGGAVLLPLALLSAAAWALYRVRRRRARESALDD